VGTRNFGPAVGSKSSISIIDELTYGRLRIGTALGAMIAGSESECYIPFTTESIAQTINMLESATLDPSRGSLPSIRGTSDIGGDIAFELRGQGYGQLIKQAMGDGATGSANYLTVAACRGDLPIQVDGYHAAGALLLNVKASFEVITDWDTLCTAGAGALNLIHVERNITTGLLEARSITLVAAAVNPKGVAGDPSYWHDITTPAIALGQEAFDGAWCFPQHAAMFSGCYLHYLELGVNLPIGLNVDIMRDIALFVYSGMKIGTWTMNFNANEIVNGTFTFVGREEFCGGVSTSEIANNAMLLGVPVNAARNIAVDDARIFCNYPGTTSKLMLGHEGNVYYAVAVPPLSATLNTDAGMDNPVPVTLTTPASLIGSITEGTDQIGTVAWSDWVATGRQLWGYFKGTPVVPMTGRACTALGPVDLRSTMVDLPPYSFFEATVLMSSGLANVAPAPPPVGYNSEGRMGVEEIEVMNATFTVEQNLYTDKYALGSRFRVKTIEQKRTVTGTLSFEFDNLNQYRKFFDGRSFAFLIKCISVDPDKGFIPGTSTSDVPYSTCFYFDNCKYTGVTPNANGPDMIMTDMPFSAAVKPGNATTKAFTELAVWMTNGRSISLW
jgi:hypothetical protein